MIYRVLVAAGLVFLAWIWWQYGQSTGPKPAPLTGPRPTFDRVVTNPPSRLAAPPPTAPQPVLASNSLPPGLPYVPPPTNVVSLPVRTNPAVVATNISRTNYVTPLPPLPTNNVVAVETNAVPPMATNAVRAEFVPRSVQNLYEAQLVMARQGISSGSLDGVLGSQTRAALRAYQERERLQATGALDVATKASLQLTVPPFIAYTVTSNDLARLQPVSSTWLGKSQQSALDYETILELVAEKGHAHPAYVKRLNPQVNWTNVAAGTEVQIPNAAMPRARAKAAFIVIHLSAKQLQAFDAGTNLIAHFPCSIAQRVEKRPVGELHVAVVAPNPNYTFNPEVFPESAEAQKLGRKLVLPPGPNNPVGVAWIGLDKPGYGIHGTPKPEEVGRTESHGCFRLANWNAEYLIRLVGLGTTVYVRE